MSYIKIFHKYRGIVLKITIMVCISIFIFTTLKSVLVENSSPPWSERRLLSEGRIATNSLDLTKKETTKAAASRSKLTTSKILQGKQVKILCFVKTQKANFDTRALAVKNTWGKRCDKLLFVSNQGSNTLPAHGVQPEVKEARNKLSEKVFKTMQFIYKNYIDAYDWIQEADDDTYIVVENLRHFLSDKNPKKAVYYGHQFKKYTKQGYASGGAGYVMSNEALRIFGQNWMDHSECKQKGAASDLKMGRCLEALGVIFLDSRDDQGRSRFHTFNVETHLIGIFPRWYYNYTRINPSSPRADFIIDYPISFHYTKFRTMYLLDYLFYRARVWGKYDRALPAEELDSTKVLWV